jgi:hypothetical protein
MLELTTELTARPTEETPAQRRAHVRHRDRTVPAPAVRYLVRPSFRSGWALLEDVSAGGVGLLLGEAAAPGAVLLIQLPGPQPGEASNRLARVVHARALPDGYWVVGCQFSRPLADEELAAVQLELGRYG